MNYGIHIHAIIELVYLIHLNTMVLEKYYSTKETLKKIGVSRNTLFLWFKRGKVPEVRRDRNGHRIFTPRDIQVILSFKNKVILPKGGYFGKG